MICGILESLVCESSAWAELSMQGSSWKCFVKGFILYNFHGSLSGLPGITLNPFFLTDFVEFGNVLCYFLPFFHMSLCCCLSAAVSLSFSFSASAIFLPAPAFSPFSFKTSIFH